MPSAFRNWWNRVLKTPSAPVQASTPTATRKGLPLTYAPAAPPDDRTQRPVVFEPALLHYSRAFRVGEPQFADDATRTQWLAARRRVMGRILRAVADSRWREHLVLRGSILLKMWVGAPAREPGDVDWVVRPRTLTPKGPEAEILFADLISNVCRPSDDCAVTINQDRVALDDIWTYDRAPGRRVVFPWQAPGLPPGAVQTDIVFNEDLPADPVETNVDDGAGGRASLWAATPEASLASKLVWLQTDTYPQGKDLYDATLLAEWTIVRPAVLRRAFQNPHAAPQTPTDPHFPLKWNVDWENFTKEYPSVQGTAQEWQQRLAAALAPTWGTPGF